MSQTLRLILGDQLNAAHSWYQQKDDSCLYLIAELHQEASYCRHHAQKICAFFAAMSSFAQALTAAGHRVHYIKLDDPEAAQPLPELITTLCSDRGIEHFEYQRPDEYRLLRQLESLEQQLGSKGLTTQQVDSEHFLLPFAEIGRQFKPRKASRMEAFYRRMRKRFQLLMTEQGEPLGGQWNYDQDNRNKLTPKDLQELPQVLLFSNSVSEITARIEAQGVQYLGEMPDQITWPVNRRQSRELLTAFCQTALPHFGRFQDAMTDQADHCWALYHSRLSFALNSKMLHPMEVINAAIEHFHQRADIDLAQIEGFVRQILGWREFVRAIYWVNMPDYASANALGADQALPEFFWDGNTKMNCVQHAVRQSLDNAYAHHIQRLMVTGNFCLIAGIEPSQVDAWYLGIYIDAIEWVELPNTRGMSQYADGGILGSKPYAASASYINRMSDYCKSCSYDHKARSSKNACPLNSLYWHFMDRHRPLLDKNPRARMTYRNWDRLADVERENTLQRGRWIRENLDKI